MADSESVPDYQNMTVEELSTEYWKFDAQKKAKESELHQVQKEIAEIEQAEAAAAAEQAAKTRPLCVVCAKEPRTVLTLPCQHLSMCESCFGRIQVAGNACPMPGCGSIISSGLAVVM
ncbi:unnamed protein product [Chrysoparadoxa australica]